MGCTFTKVRNQRSRGDDREISTVISQNSNGMDSKKDLECHTASVTRDIVEKCQLALSMVNTDEDDVLSLHMYPPTYQDEYSDTQSVGTESEMDISIYQEEKSDFRQDTSSSGSSSITEKSRSSSSLSSRLSKLFRMGKRSKLDIKGEVSHDGDYGRGDGNGDDISSSGWERSPTPSRQDLKNAILDRTNSKLSNLSQMVASKKGIHEYQGLTLIYDILEKTDLSELEIEDDGRSSSSSSSEDSIFPPQFNFRVLARPNAARGTRNFATTVPDPAEIAHHIVEFEADVEKLIDEHAGATKDYRNRQLRPGGARGPRLPSFSLQFQSQGTGTSNETMVGNGRVYSKHFTTTASRPQLTVPGLAAADDRLTQWMARQQRRDSERL